MGLWTNLNQICKRLFGKKYWMLICNSVKKRNSNKIISLKSESPLTCSCYLKPYISSALSFTNETLAHSVCPERHQALPTDSQNKTILIAFILKTSLNCLKITKCERWFRTLDLRKSKGISYTVYRWTVLLVQQIICTGCSGLDTYNAEFPAVD